MLYGFGSALVDRARDSLANDFYKRAEAAAGRAVEVLTQAAGISDDVPACVYKALGDAHTLSARFADTEPEVMAARLADGAAAYGRALELTPDDSGVHFDLGANALRRGDGAAAVASIKEALRRAPRVGVYWVGLGLALRGEPKKAQHALITALSMDERSEEAWNALATLYIDAGLFELAERCLVMSQTINVVSPVPWTLRGIIRELDRGRAVSGDAATAGIQNNETALDAYRHAVELGNTVEGRSGLGMCVSVCEYVCV